MIHCEKSGLNIRTSVQGEIKETVRKGQTCSLLGFVNGIQKDGFQWVLAEHNGVRGYAQFDSSVIWIETERREI